VDNKNKTNINGRFGYLQNHLHVLEAGLTWISDFICNIQRNKAQQKRIVTKYTTNFQYEHTK